MEHIIGVFGEWKMNKGSWNFQVNNEKGGKLFINRDGLMFDQLVKMIIEDFGINRMNHEVELSYLLPESMLKNMPKDTPLVYVNNDRQLQILWELCKSSSLRLCISVRNENRELESNFHEIPVFSRESGGKRTHTLFEDVSRNQSSDERVAEVYTCGEQKVIQKSQWFMNKSELSWCIRMLSIERKFRTTVSKSDTKLLVVKCVDKSCKWMVRGSKNDPSCEYFWVTKYIDKHTCRSRNIGAPKASARVMSKLLLENFGNAGLDMKPKLIAASLKKRYGLDVKYWNIWKAREDAREEVLGSPESSYAQLPVYLHKIKNANPGTIACLEIDDQQRFKYLFFSFAASAKGYKYMRKVIVVDGTFLKGKYKGILLVATAQDGDSHIYPLAFGIVDSENNASWEWFFRNLKSVVSDDPRLVVISDRHASIAEAVEKVYPLARRGICTYHLRNNILTKSGGKKIVRLVDTTSKAYTTEEFNVIFAEIRRQNRKLSVYLEEADVRLWSRAYFPGDKYDITTSNSAESINALLKKSRELPILPLIEAIRNTLTRWFFDRRESAAKLSSSLTPKVEKEVNKRCDLSLTFDVQPINQYQFQVTDRSRNYLVDLQKMTCTCRVFDVEKIPCKHAAKAATSRGIDPSLLVHYYYSKSNLYAAYSESIIPVDELSESSEIPANIRDQICLPPETRRSVGRPIKRRYQGIGEQMMRKKAKKQQNCSRCHRSGHNRATCDFGI